jgi:hypothetical protein
MRYRTIANIDEPNEAYSEANIAEMMDIREKERQCGVQMAKIMP